MKNRKAKFLILAVIVSFAFGTLAQAKLSSWQQKELDTLSGQLADPGRSAKTKLDAAELLLVKDYPEATKVLGDFLISDNQEAKVAVAEAVARGHRNEKSFIDPLVKMLIGPDEKVRPSAARALATYKDHGVTEKLISIVQDKKRPRDIRIVTISALQLVLDKRTVDTLVQLLDDKDPVVQEASAKALAKLTNIKAFATNRKMAREWWRSTRGKAPSEWLADLTDSLARSKTELQNENEQLRNRLNQALRELYNVTPVDGQEKLLLNFLGDQLAEVRLAGVTILESRTASGYQPSEQLSAKGLALLGDPEYQIRQKAALLAIYAPDSQKVLTRILNGLKTEEVPAVRVAFLMALGKIGKADTCDVLIKDIAESPDPQASTAAVSLARIASRYELGAKREKNAVKAIIKRYHASRPIAVELRESLIAAMGDLKSKEFSKVLLEGLKDRSATVRLAAVEAMQKYRNSEWAKEIAPLIDDPDRGVRRAVIIALAKIDGVDYLGIIIDRSNPELETDEEVRDQAWQLAEKIITTSDVSDVEKEISNLKGEKLKLRIAFLEKLIARIRQTSNGKKLLAVQKQLGLCLVKASRYGEAADILGQAYEGHVSMNSATSEDVWLMWVNALLLAGDSGVIGLMANHISDDAFGESLKMLEERLQALKAAGNKTQASELAKAAIKGLSQRITVKQRNSLNSFVKQ